MASLCFALAAALFVARAAADPGGSDPKPVATAVEAGRYLAAAGNCGACHTAEGGAPFAGGVKFETAFGDIYSTNITPDEKTGIGGWSPEDFRKAMRHGVRPDGARLYPAFPYTSFAKMSDADIDMLYAYLKTLPPVAADEKRSKMKFPYNMRFLMAGWNMLNHRSAVLEPDKTKSAEWNRGAYLVEALGHCAECHTPRDSMGAKRKDLAFAGGSFVERVKSGDYRPWSAPNLTPAPTGLAAWSEQDIVDYLKTGKSARATTFGPMNDVIMNSTRHLSDADLKSIAAYLKAAPAVEQKVAAKVAPAGAADAGRNLYAVNCGACHLPTGLGADDLGPPLAGSAVVQASDPATLINAVLYGPQLPPAPFESGRRKMEPFSRKLSDHDLASLATYVRGAWGNSAGAVTAKDVARQRATGDIGPALAALAPSQRRIDTPKLTPPAHAFLQGGNAGFVVSHIEYAVGKDASETGACPDGMTEGYKDFSEVFLGLPEMRQMAGETEDKYTQRLFTVAFGDGNYKNLCINPELGKPNPTYRTVTGRNIQAFGIDLDGVDSKTGAPPPPGACAHEDFVGMNGEPGIDNQYYRVTGCEQSLQSTGAAIGWKTGMLAGEWGILIALSGVDDLRNDDSVDVTFVANADPIMLSAARDPLDYATYAMDQDPRFRATAKGRIVEGVLTSEPVDMRFHYVVNSIRLERPLRSAVVQATISDKGEVEGYLAGYMPVEDLYDMNYGFRNGKDGTGAPSPYRLRAGSAIGKARVLGYTCEGVYHALKKHADGHPDPETGECTSISMQYKFKAIPAFVVDEKTASVNAELAGKNNEADDYQ